MTRTFCKQPDRDVPGIACGYPLPCPHHTVLIKPSGPILMPTVPDDANEAALLVRRLRSIQDAVSPRKTRARRR